MKLHHFEQRVIALWTTTRVPLTRANLLGYTKASRVQMDAWLDEMTKAELLELDSDDDGELLWKLRGAARPRHGAESLGDLARLERLSAEVAEVAPRARVGRALGRPAGAVADRKSPLLSGGLSLFFGPLGWLYAAPMKEALPGAFVYILLCSIVPKVLLAYLLGPFNAVAALAGVVYAWSYNQSGKRQPLLLKDPPNRLPPPRW